LNKRGRITNEIKRDEMLNYFEEIKKIKFKSIMDGLKNKDDDRLELDKMIADMLKIKISKQQLKEIYESIYKYILSEH
jgi:hypothetical protein